MEVDDKLKSKNLGRGSNIPDKIINEIRDALLRGDLKPGDKLPTEDQLASKFSVSRIVVREAMKMLVVMGAVEIKRGDGTYVTKGISAPVVDPLIFNLLLTGGAPEELLELREMLEVGILEIVLKKVTKEDIYKMKRAIELLEENCKKGETNREILREHDLCFHYAFAGATHNPLIIKIAKTIWEMFRVSIEKAVHSRTEDTVERHKMILEAIEEKNLEKAKEAIYLSLEKWGKGLSP